MEKESNVWQRSQNKNKNESRNSKILSSVGHHRDSVVENSQTETVDVGQVSTESEVKKETTVKGWQTSKTHQEKSPAFNMGNHRRDSTAENSQDKALDVKQVTPKKHVMIINMGGKLFSSEKEIKRMNEIERIVDNTSMQIPDNLIKFINRDEFLKCLSEILKDKFVSRPNEFILPSIEEFEEAFNKNSEKICKNSVGEQAFSKAFDEILGYIKNAAIKVIDEDTKQGKSKKEIQQEAPEEEQTISAEL